MFGLALNYFFCNNLVSISGANTLVCAKLLKGLQVTEVTVDLPLATAADEHYAPFAWSAVPEADHASDYVRHLKQLFIPNSRVLDITALSKWTGPNSLWHVGIADSKLNGTPDVAIYIRNQQATRMTESRSLMCGAAVVYFELGKPDPQQQRSLYARKESQAKLEALCARLSVAGDADLCPILVVTDLQDEWNVLWLQVNDDGKLELCISLCRTRTQAFNAIRSVCLTWEEDDRFRPLTAKERRVRTQPMDDNSVNPLQKRFKPLPKPDIANLDDIADFCTPEDIIMAYKHQLRVEFPERFTMYPNTHPPPLAPLPDAYRSMYG